MNNFLMDRIIDQIEKTPELHFQKNWATKTDCGTAHCVAGWACVLEGFEMLQWELRETGSTNAVVDTQEREYPVIRLIRDVGETLLDLDSDQAEMLFGEDNTLEDIKRIVKEINNGEL